MIYDFQRILSFRLVAWSLASIVTGALCWFFGVDFWRGFGAQAMLWGLIDGVVAWVGSRGLDQKLIQPVDVDLARKEAVRIRNVLWFNSGLDVFYIAGGVWLLVSPLGADPFMAGMGWGVLAQGGFLLLFDVAHALTSPGEILLPELDWFTDPQFEPFTLEGGRPAALLVHGFPGTPFEMRGFAEALHAEGWTVRAPLLRGFGSEFRNLFLQRLSTWEAQVNEELDALLATHSPVLVVGYSMGGGLCLLAVERALRRGGNLPAGLALMAPFWIDEKPLHIAGASIGRLFVPVVLRPYFRIGPVWADRLRRQVNRQMPGIGLQAPEFYERLNEVRVPLLIFEQFRALGRKVRAAAPGVDLPVLVIQGLADRIVTPRMTRRLAGRLPRAPRLVEVESDHYLFRIDTPAWTRARDELTAFARSMLK